MRKTRYIRLAMILAVLCTVFSCGRKSHEREAESAPEQMPEIGFHYNHYTVDSTRLKSGETFSTLMSRLGLGNQASYKLTTMCDTLIDLRKLKAGNPVRAYYDTTGGTQTLRYVVYEQDKVRSTVFQCLDSLAVWNYNKPVERQRRFADVTIRTSLWNDMLSAGATPNLIMRLYNQSVCEGEVVAIDTVHFSLFNGKDGKEVAAVLFDTGTGGSNTYWDKGGVSLKRMFLKAPLKYNRISSRFSYRRKHPVTGKVKAHTAVDYAAPTGTEVHAIGDGTVTKCGWDASGGGNRIRIKHMQGYESSYMHLSKFAKGIKVGTRVSQGQVIGYVGATGTATGPHLDFRIWEKGKPIDPLSLNSPASEPLNKKYLQEFNALYDRYMHEIGEDKTPAIDAEATAAEK